MVFITTLPRNAYGLDSIWVIMDRLINSMHFIPVQENTSAEKLDDVYIREVVAHDGVHVSKVSDRDVRFTSRCWKRFHYELDTHISTQHSIRRTMFKASGQLRH